MSVRSRMAALLFLIIWFTPWCLAQDRIIALHGTVVSAESVIPGGWIAIQSGKILSVSKEKPAAANAVLVETDGYIYPGFVDLHNHPMYAIFPRWSPSETFDNRYQWRNNSWYKINIGVPAKLMQAEEAQFCNLNEYGELRALTGGTTSIHGISPQKSQSPFVPPCLKGAIRHLDWYSGLRGQEIGNERVLGLLGVRDASPADLADARARLTSGALDRLLIHLAEGKQHDSISREELDILEKAGLLSAKTSIIHGTALDDSDLARVARAGSSLIWSPRSNISLYGETERLSSLLSKGITVAIAPDWPINGSSNMLAELRYARSLIPTGLLSDQRLFEMTTLVPAQLAGLSDQIGSLAVGKRADLFVLRSASISAFSAVVTAHPQDVTLVMVNGRALFGTQDQLAPLIFGADFTLSSLEICGTKRLLAIPLPASSVEDLKANLAKRLRDFSIDLAPLAECE